LTPEIPVASEEDAASIARRLTGKQFWLVDPLDGTREFLAGNGEFTVNIALVRGGESVLGVVFAPVLDQMYWGGKGFGAFRSWSGAIEPIHVAAAVKAGGVFRVVASRSHFDPETGRFIERLGESEVVRAGSSLKFCRIAEGAADVYPRLGPTCEWDTAAAQAVVEGAGGFVYDLDGTALRYGKKEILNPHFIAASVPLAALGRK
jgi:3'(2'), 5'-bisphosphate nucleotidase